MEDEPLFLEEVDGSREQLVFDTQDALYEGFAGVIRMDAHRRLQDDRAVVHVLIHEVGGASAQFDAVGKGLALPVDTLEGGQECGMYVDDVPVPLLDKVGREDVHVPGTDGQFDVVRSKNRIYFTLVGRLIPTVNVPGIDTMVSRPDECTGIPPVAYDDGNRGVNDAARTGIDDGLQVRATAGRQNADCKHDRKRMRA
jgi:hypothetical protein